MFLMRKKEYLITTNRIFIHSSEDAINEITNLRFLGVSVFWFKSTIEKKNLLGITTNTLNMILLLHVLANTEQIVNFRPSQLIAYMQEKRKPLEKKIILA